ncbi:MULTISPECIES: pathogenicity island protein [unclassified Staphylococcus]|uniref:pathogenicity island protein n=1 Tax=unclassified Staphylococcus TaxID=91994 RepID=UPI0021D165FF|nr:MULTISPECIES: pathogenicity island protein [unclassified Staphylococcus]UXR75712.1 pathogenicity island protein [Staphylococcus sp. IVB6233]UXR76769.1 pathogenicity island protein [Staphylococcus sp. IVB6233]UXR80898.1 pathogenicity island protein [Staphylococcus sp. IVB6218]
MKVKQKYELSKVVRALEKVLYEENDDTFLSVKDRFHSMTEHKYDDTTFYERFLKLVHKELFNILAELDFDDEAFSIIDEVNATLDDVRHETQKVYHYSVINEKGEHKHTTDRKGHIIGMLEWALEYIVGNIEVEE